MGSIADSAKDLANTAKAGLTENKKIADLQRDIKDAHSKQIHTTDHGVPIHDLDHWLKNVDPKTGRVGSHYLEDQIGRERVGASPNQQIACADSLDSPFRP
jgi:hypothetical protein